MFKQDDNYYLQAERAHSSIMNGAFEAFEHSLFDKMAKGIEDILERIQTRNRFMQHGPPYSSKAS